MKKILIFASWPYLHTLPGIHNLIPLVAADVYSRFNRMRNHEVIFISGSDEYGARTELIAKRLKDDPNLLMDRNYEKLSYLLIDWLGLSTTWFTRTTKECHGTFVKSFYHKLDRMGYIEKKSIQLLFCENCNIFLPDRFVEGTCPSPTCRHSGVTGIQCKVCGKIFDPFELSDPRCAICGTKPTQRSNVHWFFDLSRLAPKLEKYLASKTHWTGLVKEYAGNILKNLRPFLITRDIKWGIPAPFESAEGKTIFCWADSLLGNLSTLRQHGSEDIIKDPSVSTVYFMGRDNIPFYSILLPALFMAIDEGYNLPDNIVAHNFLTFLGNPCSKSSGNGIWLNEAQELLGNPDYWRYYLLKNIPFKEDVSFEWDDFVSTINNDLVNVLSTLIWKIALKCNSWSEFPSNTKKAVSEFEKKIYTSAEWVEKLLEKFDIPQALTEVISLARFGLEKFIKIENKHWSNETIFSYIYLCRNIAVMLLPFLPKTAEHIWEIFGFKGQLEDQQWDVIGLPPTLSIHTKISGPEYLFDPQDKGHLLSKFSSLRRRDHYVLRKIGEYCEVWRER